TLRTWDGGGTNNLWLNPTNWSGDNAPVQGDSLRFPEVGASRRTNFNDFPAESTFGFLHFDVPIGGTLDYALTGNALRLNDGVAVFPSGTSQLDMNGTVVVSNHLGINQNQVFTNSL